MKISDALEGYSITNRAENKSSQTIAAARWHVSKFAAWLSSQDDGAPIQLTDVTPQSFRAFLQHESQRSLRPHSVHAHHKCISTFLCWCIREELIQHDPLKKWYLFTFLYVDAVAPTNNAAERELRPAVIIRKTNGCNRSPKGRNGARDFEQYHSHRAQTQPRFR